MNDKFEPTIGIECHVQLKTKSKLFARVSNDARGAEPNTTVSAICFGLPGVLPYLNEEAVNLAVKAGLALNAKIAEFSKFDRKHYFYPDLPKGYQITQYDQPIVGEGWVEIKIDNKIHKIGIERAHLEEDAGKLTHPDGADYSLVDLNRAGTPLLEIVSKPDIKSPAIAKAYARELYLLMKYAGVSDVDLYHGHMRFDVNISVARTGSSEFGTRTEVKNLNSFRSVERAAAYEFKRQVEVLQNGQQVVQETRGWDDAKLKTFSQRSKEEAHDYRYFPEPDLPPITLKPEFIESVSQSLSELPSTIRQKFASAGIDPKNIETMLDNPNLLSLIQPFLNGNPRLLTVVSTYLLGTVLSYANKNNDTFKLDETQLQEVANMQINGSISSSGADRLLVHLLNNGGSANDAVSQLGLLQISDESSMAEIVEQVLAENPKAAEDVKKGEEKAVGFLVGQVMAKTNGQANPQLAKDMIRKKLQ